MCIRCVAMDNFNPASVLTEQKDWLVNEIRGTASWCGHVATLFPNDTRNIRCSKTLYELATAVKDLPPTHVLFFKLAQIDRVDEGAYLRWLDELRLEMSYIGHLLAESVEVAIQRLIEITDASLTEWRQSTVNLH
jgi:hypothetical protein